MTTKKANKKAGFTILQDTKEKMPWHFEIFDCVKEQKPLGLKTADYTLLGHEDKICIERKRNTGEIAINLGQKARQFAAELVRMKEFKYKYLICEFSEYHLLEFPNHSGIPKYLHKSIKVSGNFLYSRLVDWTTKYDVELFFANNRDEAQELAIELFKDYIHKYE